MSTLISTRFIVTHLLIIGLVLTFANHVAPANGATTHARVIVDVSSESHQAIIKSYLHRSLRGLDDVKICHDLDFGSFEISVLHTQREYGLHVLSVVIQFYMSPTTLSAGITPLLKHAVFDRAYRPCIVLHHQLLSGGTDKVLEAQCERIVAVFDTAYLEVWRLLGVLNR